MCLVWHFWVFPFWCCWFKYCDELFLQEWSSCWGAAGTQPWLSALFGNPFSANTTASSQGGGPHTVPYMHRVQITSLLTLTWVKPTLKSNLVSELPESLAGAFLETPLQPNFCLILLLFLLFRRIFCNKLPAVDLPLRGGCWRIHLGHDYIDFLLWEMRSFLTGISLLHPLPCHGFLSFHILCVLTLSFLDKLKQTC